MQRLLLSFIFTLSVAFVFAENEKQNIPANLKSVTVYYTGAEIIHTAVAQLKPGNNELIIENVANAIDISSIQVKTPNGITVSGIEFSNNYLPETKKSARLVFLVDSLEHLQNNLSNIEESLNTTVELKELLKSNRDIKGTQTGLSVTELAKMVTYYKGKMQELQEDYLAQQSKKKKINELIKNLQAQINEEQSKNIIPAGRLSLQVYAAIESNATLLISYIAKNASWAPSYDVNIENTKNPIRLVYKAKISQTTGIDWKRVKLSLSTGTPAQYGSAPDLQSWYVGYQNPYVNDKIRIRGVGGSLAEKAPGMTLSELTVVGYAKRKNADTDEATPSQPIYVIDGNVASKEELQSIDPKTIKHMEVLKGDNATAIYGTKAAAGAIVITLKSGMENYVAATDKALNTVFDLDIPMDVPTTGKDQTAVIKAADVPAIYTHFSVPTLDPKAYLIANLPNWEKQNLLPGEANIIFENTYLGKAFINPNNVKDTFSLTLSDDKRVSIKREKLNDFSSTKFLSNYKLQKFVYEITVKNNKNEAISLSLKDQFPISTDNDIDVELLESGNAVVNKETGFLDWKMNLAAGEVKKIRFAYSIKYAKDKTINMN